MKTAISSLCLLIFLLSTSILHPQQLETVSLLPPESREHHDLEILRAELEQKRLVTLGEMTHMYGNIFEMKARLVEYLHRELGFTTIAMESSMYDLWLMNRQHPNFEPAEFNKSVFGVWAGTEEFQRLVRYIDENGLKVMGFDSQVVQNVPEFVDGFLTFCEKQGIDLGLNQDDMGITMEDLLDEAVYPEDDISFKRFEKELQRIIKRIAILPDTSENFYWLQFSKSLLATARDAYYEEEIDYKSDYADKNHNYRDAQMADNLLAYMRRHPEEKIVAWGDNIHFINDLSSVKDPVLKEFVSMGSHLKKALGGKVYSLATLHANDSLLERTTWHQTPVLKASFEDRLAALGEPFLFVSAAQEGMRLPQQHRLLNYVHFTEARLDQLHDGYIFLRHASLPRKRQHRLPTAGESDGEEATSDTATEPGKTSLAAGTGEGGTSAPTASSTAGTKDGEKNFTASAPGSGTLEGEATTNPLTAKAKATTAQTAKNIPWTLEATLLDSETGAPVPYATIILLEGDLYRISDTEGRFGFRVTKELPKHGHLQISSMGYETREIPLSAVPGQIELTPSLAQLDEVVIESYSTTPKKVLKKAIKKIGDLYSMSPYNFSRYGHFVLNSNDEKLQDLELITTDYSGGAREKKHWVYHRVEQVKWNLRHEDGNYESAHSLTAFREDPLQYASILHKRRYRKFELEFVTSNKPQEQGLYIIRFSTDKTRFGYTNRWYPTAYSGLVYINKKDYAIVKVVEHWDVEIAEKKMEKVKYWLGEFQGVYRGKFENTSVYGKQQDGKYYPTAYFARRYSEKTNMKGEFVNNTFEGQSYLSGHTAKDLQVMRWEERNENAALDRVEFDEEFWEGFDAAVPNLPVF